MKKKNPSLLKRMLKKRPCSLCRDKVESVDYRDVGLLGRFISEKGRIISSRISGNCAKHQRMVSNAIKKARLAAFLPFVKIKEGLSKRKQRRS